MVLSGIESKEFCLDVCVQTVEYILHGENRFLCDSLDIICLLNLKGH